MNTNKNSYTLIYAAVMVVVVAFLLAFVSSALRSTQEQNVALDKKKQILSALGVRGVSEANAVEAKYSECIQADMIIDANGEVVKSGEEKDKAGFALADRDISAEQGRLPVYVCEVDSSVKYVFPVLGKGLWGPIWGYIAVNEDMQTVFGVYISHEGETAGLGALIKETKFHDLFRGKQLFTSDDTLQNEVALTVVKSGKVEQDKATVQVDGITGATLTSKGVAAMLHDGLAPYLPFMKQKREELEEATPCQQECKQGKPCQHQQQCQQQ